MILQVPGQGNNKKSPPVSLNSKTEAVARSFVDLVQESEDLKTTDLCMYLRENQLRVIIYTGGEKSRCILYFLREISGVFGRSSCKKRIQKRIRSQISIASKLGFGWVFSPKMVLLGLVRETNSPKMPWKRNDSGLGNYRHFFSPCFGGVF